MDNMKIQINDQMQEIKEIEVIQENVILPQLQFLFEGHGTNQSQIRNTFVIDGFQDGVSTLKNITLFLS